MTRTNTFRARCKSRSCRRSGSIVVIVALALVVLFGFCALAVDYGQLVWRKNQLQRACDASALAGATQLPDKTKAQQVAGTVAEQNNVRTSTYAFPSGVQQIQVSASQSVQFGFARVMGIASGIVSASATAQRVGLRGIKGAVPLTITPADYEAHKGGDSFELLLIDNNRQAFIPGTMSALDMRPDSEGKSPAVFQRDMTDGYDKIVYFNQPINNSLNASLPEQGTRLTEAMTQRFADAAAAPYADTGTNYIFPNYPNNDRRIIPLLISDPQLAGIGANLTARGIVPVYVETVRSPLGDNLLFMRMRILSNRIYSSDDPNVIPGDNTTPDNGFATVRLVS